MKASEMTNDQIADAIEKRVADAAPSWDFAPTLREAAARLSKLEWLKAKIKVAEDALYDILRVAENRLPSQPTIEEIEAVVKAKAELAKASGESEVAG